MRTCVRTQRNCTNHSKTKILLVVACMLFMLSLEFAVKLDIVWQLQESHFCRTGMIFYTTKAEVSKSSMYSPLQDMHCLQGEKGAVIGDVRVEGFDSKNHYLCGVPQPQSSVPLLNLLGLFLLQHTTSQHQFVVSWIPCW